MDDSKEVLVVYFRVGKATSGKMQVYKVMSVPNMFLNTYEDLMYKYLRFEGYKENKFKDIMGTFKIKNSLNILNIVERYRGTYDTIRVYMDGRPFIMNDPLLTYRNKNFETVIKNKEQLIGFHFVENKYKDIRLFYNSMSKDFILVDCKMEEIETIYNDFTNKKTPDSIGYYIQDINKHKQVVTWNDLNAFCQKEIGFNKRNRFHERNKKTLEQKIISILTAEFDEEFFNIYHGMSY